MDQFSRTLLPAAAEAGLSTVTVARHAPLIRRSVGRGDTVLLVARCHHLGRTTHHDLLLALTPRRMVVTEETRLFGRVRRCLNLPLSDLRAAHWQSQDRPNLADLALYTHATSYHLRVRLAHAGQAEQITALLTHAVRGQPHLVSW